MSMSSGTAAGMSSSKNVWVVVSGAREPHRTLTEGGTSARSGWPFVALHLLGRGWRCLRAAARGPGSPIGCALASWLWRAAGAGASACPRGPRPDQERGVPALPRAGPKSSPLRTRASPARQHRATWATSSDAPVQRSGSAASAAHQRVVNIDECVAPRSSLPRAVDRTAGCVMSRCRHY